MLVRDVGFIKASVMYYAVYVFGPHWGELQVGVPCGPNCTRVGNTKIAYQPADYNLSHASELKEVQQRIANAALRGAPLNLASLEALAAKKHWDNSLLRMRKTK